MTEITATDRSRAGAPVRASRGLRTSGPVVAGWALPFALVFYLALKGGGYDAVLRSEVGIAVWWIVLLGAAAGVLPAHRVTKAGWITISGLIAFAAWTALGIGWSESAERSSAELARVTTLLGVLVLAVSAQGRDGLRRTVGALAAAIGFVGLLAVLSRLQPEWFPANEVAEVLPASQARLSFPFGYWNGLAAFVAIGLPLVTVVAVRARTIAVEALAVATIPVLALTIFLTLSRGGVIEAAAGVLVLLALHPLRARVASALGLGGIGAAILIAAATQRDALMDGLTNTAARAQGDEMLAIVIVVCTGIALLQVAVGLLFRYVEGPSLRLPIPRSKGAVVGAAVVALGAAVIAGVPGELADGWESFKEPAVPAASADRFDTSSGSGRYQWWSSSIDAGASEALTGIGPGSFEFWWAREGTIPGFVKDAHSLYLETFAELGIIGLLTIAGLMAGVLWLGVRRTLSATGSQRELAAGATASCAVFAVAAGIDWAWELAAIPVAFFLLAAALAQAESRDVKASSRMPRGILAGVSALALVAIALPLASTASVRSSQTELEAQRLGPALEEARAAGVVQPYAASPTIQEALVLESAGDLDGAAAAAAEATRDEPTNWRTWFVLSRVEAQRGNASASVDAYSRARELNPRSPLFQ